MAKCKLVSSLDHFLEFQICIFSCLCDVVTQMPNGHLKMTTFKTAFLESIPHRPVQFIATASFVAQDKNLELSLVSLFLMYPNSNRSIHWASSTCKLPPELTTSYSLYRSLSGLSHPHSPGLLQQPPHRFPCFCLSPLESNQIQMSHLCWKPFNGQIAE